jgi:2-desacetyl-2-hydroxyethyl bacteriochlorophyllide A dehydrogenase
MRAVMSKDGEVFVVDSPKPEGEGVLIKITNSGICGSDLHTVALGLHGVVLGHEFGGYTEDGQLVAVRPTGECGQCSSCMRGAPNLCSEAMTHLYGAALNGGLSDYALVDPVRLTCLPTGAHPEHVGLVEPIAVAAHGVRRSGAQPGHKVLVIGGGSIGLLAVAVLRDLGIEVDIMARHPHQQRAAEMLGARNSAERNYDIVFDAAATQSAFDSAVRTARKGGTIVEYGMFWEPISLHNPVMLKEITIVPAMFYNHNHDHNDFAYAAELVARSPHVAEAIVTHRFTLSDAKEAFAVANNREAGAIKVHLHP